MRVKCLAQEHNALTPARARTQAARPRDERTNHEATVAPIQGGVEIFLVASCHRIWEKLRPDGPLGLYADFTIPVLVLILLYMYIHCTHTVIQS